MMFPSEGVEGENREKRNVFPDIEKDALGIAELNIKDYIKAMAIGCHIVNLPGNDTFYVVWVPDGFSDLEEKRVMVMLHGSNGNAYQRILVMQDTAEREKFGIVSIQWGWPEEPGGEYTYLDSKTVHGIIIEALDYMEETYGVDKQLSAWDGFSMASTHCAEYAFWDRYFGTYFFTFFIAVSGGVGQNLPVMKDLLNGEYGPSPISGSHFYFWCSLNDQYGLRFLKMLNGRRIVETLGGTVDVFRVSFFGGHGGYYHNQKYQQEAVTLWKNR